MFELFWKPNVCTDMEIMPGRVGARLSLRLFSSGLRFGSHHGSLLSSFLNCLRLGQPDMWGPSFIDAPTAELVVLNMVLEKESLACSLYPVSPLPLLICEEARGRRKARRKTCRVSRSITQMSICLAFKLETREGFLLAALRN